MRKDLRVGLGIGGVLLAVLVVAIIVRSHGKDQTKLAKGETAAQTDPPEGTGEPTPPGDVQQNPPPESLAGDAPNGKKGDPFEPDPAGASHGGAASPSTPGSAASNSPDDWEKILNASSPGPIRSLTPAPGAPTGRAAKGRDKNNNLPPGLAAKDRASGNDGAGAGANGTEPITISTPNRGTGQASPGTPRSHVIKTGETFTSIARTVYGDGRYYLQILKANPGLEPSALKPGTRINLPDLTQASGESRTTGRASRGARGAENTGTGASIDPRTQYKVEQNDSLYKIAEKLYGDGTRMDALYEANKQAIGPDPRKLKLGMVLKLPEQPTVASASK